MFLKRLTMKGFKSFADTTVLEFEPGVTAVVGPNGSGKSNVVDAVTWVLGAQSTRALRSAKMDDVIFAGTANRAALGRCEVELTLDNSSGRLSIDGAEVTISRTLFRNGDSEYAINGTVCRLLDVQELLSDSGVGRQQHMIIGQNQLDSILNSSPENRRSVIEEAAGVLKHRRRKERAERRLHATQENLERLGDLVREIRRQMRPLERQAVSARSYADIEGELRHAREALLRRRLTDFERRRLEIEETLQCSVSLEQELRSEMVDLDAQATATAGEMSSRREEVLASTLGILQGLGERARGTLSVISERERALRAALNASADENVVATLEADAARLRTDLAALAGDDEHLVALRAALALVTAEYAAAQRTHEVQWSGVSSDGDRIALDNLRERLSLLERNTLTMTDAVTRSSQRLRDAHSSLEAIEQSLHENSRHLVDDDLALAAATTANEAALLEVRRRDVERGEANEALRAASDLAARTQARSEALERALEELSGSGGRAIVNGLDGVLGSLLDLIEVDEGFERAVESAAGASVSAVVVDGRHSAQAALEALRREGGAGLILAANERASARLDAPEGTTSLRDRVRARRFAPADVTRILDTMFNRAFVSASFHEGIDVAITHPDVVIVTRDGDRFASSGWRVASGRAVVTRSTVDEARAGADHAAADLATSKEVFERAEHALAQARHTLETTTNHWRSAQAAHERHQRDAARNVEARTGLVERVAQLESEVSELRSQLEPVERELATLRAEEPALEQKVTRASARASERAASASEVLVLQDRVRELTSEVERAGADVAARRSLMEQRQEEIELRLAGRSRERAQAAARREALEFDRHALARLAEIVGESAREISHFQESLDSTYREQLQVSRASAQRLESLRSARHDVEERLALVAQSLHHAQIEQAELAVKVTNVHEAIRRDLGIEPDELPLHASVDVPDSVSLDAYVGDLEARITSLGPINPLAMEELAALEERYSELDLQVADVRHARREIQEVLRALDAQIMETFSAAVADVNEHFSTLISTLFPGGQGRLILTDPEDPLNTGVEIEVRPMGRNVRRISLLSGGERSMAALAFLFAIFRSRPSPFYLMDEVEAALDDVNLQRFLSLVNEFRDEAQLLIVTHQKRTMEAADALYGVTMVPGASSKVVSQRQRSITSVAS